MEQRALLVDYRTKRAVSPYGQNEKTEHILDVQTKGRIWSPKQRRAYQRIMSGYKFAQYSHERLRFMTLTTSNEGKENDIKKDLNTLVKRIRRKYGFFEYVRIRTNEGNGVLHILYRGTFIPRKWLQNQWTDIHSSWNVDIRDTQRYHCSYMINQYLCGQSSFICYSMSIGWVTKGFVKTWKAFCKWYYERRIELWNAYLKKLACSKKNIYLLNSKQLLITDYG